MNNETFRSPSKVRTKRQHMTEFFCDEIPTRDESPTVSEQTLRKHGTSKPMPSPKSASSPMIIMDKRPSFARKSGAVSSRRSVKDICKSFSDDYGDVDSFTSRSITPTQCQVSPPNVTTASQCRANTESKINHTATPPISPPTPAYVKEVSNKIAKEVSSKYRLKASSDTDSCKKYQVLSRNIYNLWQNQQLCDVVIKAGGRNFRVHKLVMAASCGFFPSPSEEMSHLKMIEFVIPDVSAEAMEDVIKYFYTFKLSITRQNVESVIRIGHHFGITRVIDKCMHFLTNVSLDNAMYNRYVAQKYNLSATVAIIDKFLNDNFLKLVNTPSFLRSHFQHVYSIVSSELCIAPNELQFFHACSSWIDFNRQERVKYAVPLMSLIQFVHISPEDLISKVECITYIFEIPECKDMLYNAFRHHALFREFLPTSAHQSHATGTTAPPTTPQRMMSETKQTMQPMPDSPHQTPTKSPMPQGSSQSVTSYAGGDIDQELINEQHIKDDEAVSSNISNLPSPHCQHVLLVFGGIYPKHSHPESMDIGQAVHQYDPASNEWTIRTHMPFPVHHCGVAVVDNTIYVIGGSRSSLIDDNANVTSICYKYNTDSNDWVCIAPMRIARTEHVVVTLCGVIYAVGGKDQDGDVLDSVEFYNFEEDMWQFTQSMKEVRFGIAAASHKGQLFVVGTVMDSDDRDMTSSVEMYDPKTDFWSMCGELPAAIYKSSLVDVNGVLYLVGGQVIKDDMVLSVDSVLRYHDDTDSWDCFQKLRIPRHDASVAIVDKKMFIVGGVSSATMGRGLSIVECIDMETGDHHEEIAPLATAAFGLACCSFSGDC